MKMLFKNKRLIILCAIVFAFITVVLGSSYAFFTYDKEVVIADLNAGSINITFSNNVSNLNLSNAVAMSDFDGKMLSNYMDFSVTGTVDTEPIYYELDIIPKTGNTLDTSKLKVYLTDQNDNVIMNVKNFNKMDLSTMNSGGRVLKKDVFSVTNGNSTTVTRNYRLRIWLDESYTETTSKNFSFDVKLYAQNEDFEIEKIWVASDTIKRNVITPANPIYFEYNSSASNGQGLYILPGTENDTNPIYYYRGAINNNNVVFGGYCWQMVRTTDTGGIKMIYNGIPDTEGSGDNVTYNCGITREFQDDIRTTTDLSQSTGYYYADDYEIVSTEGNGATYRLKSKANPITQVAIANATNASTNIPTIVANYPYTCKQTTDSGTCTVLYKVDSYASGTNANVYASIYIGVIGNSVFNSNSGSVSDVGYMGNTKYSSILDAVTGAIYGKNVEWNGNNYLVIEDAAHIASSNTTKDNNHHYSCGTVGTTSCPSVRYYYWNDFYITLTNGELVEDAIYKMTGNIVNENIDVVTRNQGYVLNQSDSTAKGVIESWFRTNLTNVVDNTKTDYRPFLEDTIYCNDRSFKTVVGNTSYPTFQESGWNRSGGDINKYLFFGTWNRFYNNWYSTTNVPSTVCPNETDRFTNDSSNGNGALTYSVGLLTADEIVMAGAAGIGYTSNTSYYLYTGGNYWSLSPEDFSVNTARNFMVDYNGYLGSNSTYESNSLRPVVSLKPGTEFETGGEGTPTNPYVVKYE